jgi:hypothetical protein
MGVQGYVNCLGTDAPNGKQAREVLAPAGESKGFREKALKGNEIAGGNASWVKPGGTVDGEIPETAFARM